VKAAVWNGENRLDITEVPKPGAGEKEAVVRVMSAGLCATDIHVIQKKIIIGSPPSILGHEISGIVEEIGDGTANVKVGDRVVLDTAMGCGYCNYCKSGMDYLCCNGGEIGTSPHNGGYAEFIKAPAHLLHKISDAISFDEGGILESFVCPAGSIYRIGIRFGDTVLIQGAGPAGLAFLQTVKACGAGKVIISGRREKRLELARKYGADVVIDAAKEDVFERVMSETNGQGVNISIEATGAKKCIEQSVSLAAKAGKVIIYSLTGIENCPPMDIQTIAIKQLTICGAGGNSSAWEPVIKMAEKGIFSIKDMVTHTFPLSQINQAIEQMNSADAIKVVIHPNDEV